MLIGRSPEVIWLYSWHQPYHMIMVDFRLDRSFFYAPSAPINAILINTSTAPFPGGFRRGYSSSRAKDTKDIPTLVCWDLEPRPFQTNERFELLVPGDEDSSQRYSYLERSGKVNQSSCRLRTRHYSIMRTNMRRIDNAKAVSKYHDGLAPHLS